MSFKTKIKDSVEDNKIDSEREKNDSDDIQKVNDLSDSKDIKIKDYDKEQKIVELPSEEKRESKFRNIDWNKDSSEERNENKFNKIDWGKSSSEEKRESKFDKIDWTKDTSKEKKEIRYDQIDWSKDTLGEKKENKFRTIDWNKDTSEKGNKSKFRNIDLSNNTFKKKKLEENKYEKVKEILMKENREKENDEKNKERINHYDVSSREVPKDKLERLKLGKDHKNLDHDQFSSDSNENNVDDQSKDYDSFSENNLDVKREIDKEYDRNKESLDEVKKENDGEYENIGSQSTILMRGNCEREGETPDELQADIKVYNKQKEEQREEIELDPKEYEKDQEPIYDPKEITFIKDMEELGRMLREAEENQGISKEDLEKYVNIGFEAEQYFRKLKERDQKIRKEEEIQETSGNEEELTKVEIKEMTFDNEPEEKPKDYPKEVENVYEADYFINAEENLHTEGKSSEEIAEKMQQIDVSYELNEEVEKVHEEQEKEKLKLIDHDNEEEGDEIEEIDRIDIIEHTVDKEEEFQQEKIPQNEIDQKIEGRINEYYQREQEEYKRKEQEKELKEEIIYEQAGAEIENLDWQEREEIIQTSINDKKNPPEHHLKTEDRQEIIEITSESEGGVEFSKEKIIELVKKTEKPKKEGIDTEGLQQLYRQKTGRRPIYAGKSTKSFCQWLKQQKIKKEELKEKDEEEQLKEKWKKILIAWIEQSEKNLLNSELKLMLMELLQKAEDLEELHRKCVSKHIPKKERDYWRVLLKIFQKKYPIHLDLYHNLYEFKTFVQESHPWDIPNVKTKFLQHVAEKYKRLKQDFKNIAESERLLFKKMLKICDKSLSIKSEINLNKKKREENLRKRLINIKKFNKNLREITLSYIEDFVKLINCSEEQKKVILSKSFKILNDFILRIEHGKCTIYKNKNLKIIAAAIIYTAATSNKKSIKITMTELEEITAESKSAISSCYYRYFKLVYPRIEFRFGKGFKEMKDKISLYFFKIIKNNSNIKVLDLVMDLKDKILKNLGSFEDLTQKDLRLLKNMIIHHQDKFHKYFSDLVEIISYLINLSRVYKKIGAKISIKPFAYLLKKKDINLLHVFDTFYLSIIEIYDLLTKNFPNFLPNRYKINRPDKLSRAEYRNVVGNKIKLFIIKNMYNGLYLIDNNVKCPKCHEERLIINTTDTRITSLEFHHKTKEKEYRYTARKLYRTFEKSVYKPNFLEDLIEQMESEGIVVLCSVHHMLRHSKYYLHFKKIINWEDIPQKFPQDIFLLPNELIHILIWISIHNYYKSRDLLRSDFHYARLSIVKSLKKRYILEKIYGDRCPTCLEFNIKDHLVSFDFHHFQTPSFNENPYIHKKHRGKIRTASELFNKSYSCSEIVQILKYEKGGYLCRNCHSVIQYSPLEFPLLNKIYEDKNIVKDILKDYNTVNKKFKLLRNIGKIEEPINKTIDISESLIRYLDAFYTISQKKYIITIQNLIKYLGMSVGGVSAFFKRHWSFINLFLDIKYKNPKFITSYKNQYFLTEKGKMYIELIHYFKEYYKRL